jgi:hypothetical protein
VEECNLDLILFFLSTLLSVLGLQTRMNMDLKTIFKKVVAQTTKTLLLNTQETLEKILMVLIFLNYKSNKLNSEGIQQNLDNLIRFYDLCYLSTLN